MVQARRKTGKQKDPLNADKVPQTSQQPAAGEPPGENPDDEADDDCPNIPSPSSSTDSSTGSSSSNSASSSSNKPVLRKPAIKVAKRPASEAQQATQEPHQEWKEQALLETTMPDEEEEEDMQPIQTSEPVDALSDTWTACVAAVSVE